MRLRFGFNLSHSVSLRKKCIIPVLLNSLALSPTETSDAENELFKKLLSPSYNVKVRPAKTPESKVVVRIGMTLASFVSLVRSYGFYTLSELKVQL